MQNSKKALLLLGLIGATVLGIYAYSQYGVEIGKFFAAEPGVTGGELCIPAQQTVMAGKPVTVTFDISRVPTPTPSPRITVQPVRSLPPPPTRKPPTPVVTWTANGGTPSAGTGTSFTTVYTNPGPAAVNRRIKVKYGNAEGSCLVTILPSQTPTPTPTPSLGAQVSVVMDPNFPTTTNIPMGTGAFLGKFAFTTTGSEDARLMGFFVNMAIVPGSTGTSYSRPIGHLYLSAGGAPVAEGVLQAQSQVPGWLWQFAWSGFPLPRNSTQELFLSGDVLPQSQNPNGPGQRFHMTVRSASDLNIIGIPSGLRASVTNRFPLQNNAFTLTFVGTPTPTPTP